MLNITREIADRYHIEFGEEKSKIMKIGKSHTKDKMMLGAMELKHCETYKYLGVIINRKNNLADHIEEAKRKAEAAFQVMMRITGNTEFHGVEMKTIWQVVETCIIPIITYGTEAGKITKTEKKGLNKILDDIIKRILRVPTSTPRGPLYYETGLLDIEHSIKKNRVNYVKNLPKKKNQILRSTLKTEGGGKWTLESQAEMAEITLTNSTRTSKKNILERIREKMKHNLRQEGEGKSKTEYYTRNSESLPTIGKRKKYMNNESRHTVSNIIMARTRMMEVKEITKISTQI